MIKINDIKILFLRQLKKYKLIKPNYWITFTSIEVRDHLQKFNNYKNNNI